MATPMLLRASLLTTACGVAFLAVAAFLRPWVPPPEADEMAARLAWFAEHKDEFDLVLIGSSNFRLGVDPRRFDETLAHLGHPVRSFNFGVEGMNAFEGRQLLDRVLAMEPKRLRWAVIELVQLRPSEWIGRNPWTDRVVGWHDLQRSAEVVESLRRAKLSASDRIHWLQMHLRHTAWRLSNIGQGPRMASALLGLDAAAMAEAFEKISKNLGFRPLGIFRSDQSPRARRELEREWAEKMARFEETRRATASTSRFDPAPIQRQVAALEKRGIEPIYVIAPIGRGTPLVEQLIAEGKLPEPLIYNRPEEFPELYDVDHRHDVTHLNARGARIWSPILAEDVARRMDEAARR
jgi:hypothetical protein